MTYSAFVYPTDTRPPRHFWRRAVAFVVDIVLFWAVLGVISLIVYFLTGWNMGVITSQTMTCDLAEPSALTRQVDTEWPLSAGETRVNQICVFSGLMMPNQRFFSSTVTKVENGVTSNRSASIGIDENGNAISSEHLASGFSTPWLGAVAQLLGSLAVGILFILISAKITATGRRTPGKALLSLRIVDSTAATPTLQRSLKRELFKLLPAGILDTIVSVLLFKSMWDLLAPSGGNFSAIIGAVREPELSGIESLLAVQLIGTILMFIWWFGPFIVWRGQTFYDRIAGCFVVRSEATTINSPTPT